MKTSSRRLVVILPLLCALLACTCSLPTSLPDIQIPSLQTRAAASAVTSGKDQKIGNGPTVASQTTAQSLIDKNADLQFMEELAKEQYKSEEMSQPGKTYTYTIALEQEQPLVLLNGWCTTSEKILEDNFKHIKLSFTVNGTAIDPKNILVTERQEGDMYCRSFFAIIYDWPRGKTEVVVAVTFDAKINDGLADYPKGTHYYKYVVNR